MLYFFSPCVPQSVQQQVLSICLQIGLIYRLFMGYVDKAPYLQQGRFYPLLKLKIREFK